MSYCCELPSSSGTGKMWADKTFFRPRNNQDFNLAQHGQDKGAKDKKKPVPEKNGELFEHITCYSCKLMGHYSDQFTSQSGTSLMQISMMFTQNRF